MLLHKPLATFATFVRFDPGMDSFMDVLLLVRREALIAERARILKKGKYFRIAIEELGLRPIPHRSGANYLLFTIMGSLMHVTNMSPCECLPANST